MAACLFLCLFPLSPLQRELKKKKPPPVRSQNFTFSLAAVSAGSPPVVRRLFEVNSEPHTGARPSVRLCVGLIKRAGNAQREHKLFTHSALAVFLTALLTRAGERTARTLLQRKYRRIRETQHANGVPFHTTKKTPTQPPFPPHSPSRGNLGRRDNTRINAIPHETRRFRGPSDKDGEF
jgi:hypothetical protein